MSQRVVAESEQRLRDEMHTLFDRDPRRRPFQLRLKSIDVKAVVE